MFELRRSGFEGAAGETFLTWLHKVGERDHSDVGWSWLGQSGSDAERDFIWSLETVLDSFKLVESLVDW